MLQYDIFVIDEPPGYVNNLTVVTEPGCLNVTVSWQAPEETGSRGIAAYVIQWGPVISEYPFPILGDEHILKVPQVCMDFTHTGTHTHTHADTHQHSYQPVCINIVSVVSVRYFDV